MIARAYMEQERFALGLRAGAVQSYLVHLLFALSKRSLVDRELFGHLRSRLPCKYRLQLRVQTVFAMEKQILVHHLHSDGMGQQER